MFRAKITTTIPSRHVDGKCSQFVVDLPYPDLVAVYAALTERGAIIGNSLIIVNDEEGRRVLKHSFEQILTIGSIATISACPYEIFEPAGAHGNG